MAAFSTTLYISRTRIVNNLEIPVLYQNKVIGSCMLKLCGKLVIGMFNIDEEHFPGIRFYYNFCPAKKSIVTSIQVEGITEKNKIVITNAVASLFN